MSRLCLAAKLWWVTIGRAAFGCTDQCQCTDYSRCHLVCPNNARTYVHRIREVDGLSLDNISVAPAFPPIVLPEVVTAVYHRSRRRQSLVADAIAIPLNRLVNSKGKLKYRDRESLAKRFRISPHSQLIISGVSKDRFLEMLWERRSAELLEQLRLLNPDLVTSPNFSLFANAPRVDNLYNMKRIARVWREFAVAGIRCALHIYARTPTDMESWTTFVNDHPELTWVSVEFSTGLRRKRFAQMFLSWLVRFGDRTNRRLNVIVRGGRRHLGALRDHFRSVVYVDSDAFFRAMKNRQLEMGPDGKWNWESVFTLEGQPVDDILAENVRCIRQRGSS